MIELSIENFCNFWRRRWDLDPRHGYPYNGFALRIVIIIIAGLLIWEFADDFFVEASDQSRGFSLFSVVSQFSLLRISDGLAAVMK